MRKLTVMILTFVLLLLLTGCSNKINDFKEAASGIDSAANKAADAISIDVHTIRAIEIKHNHEVFTVNELFKTILRDVRWEYEKKENRHIFTVRGTWKDSLFENYHFTAKQKEELKENGKVTVELEIVDGKIEPTATKVIMKLNDKIVVEQKGKKALNYFYDYYTSL